MAALETYRDRDLTLPGLVAAAREVLAEAAHPVDDRVSAFPDERTLRWYRTLGLLDAPTGHRGREALYGYRHLLQAVCVKVMQTEGHTLAQIQRALTGVPTPRLEARAGEALGLPTPRAPVTTEVAPGVTVTVDPRLVADPDGLLARIARSLQG